ncbi:hypothetical protein [Herpetosiphon llansteffanensis]|uniref:hypothetical protein n=1 Tax=Herpetosiphon llansteffanensis TaxID=2094568 RepID=UPI000D7D1472|nr:hypothetical protein [Herpetosiphon llansteffanensis]
MFFKRELSRFIGCIGLLVLLSSCATQVSNTAWYRSGRYAVQFIGLISAKAHDVVPIQLAFIDVGEPRRSSEIQFNQLTLLSDKGELSTQSVTLTPSPATTNYRFFSVLAMLDGLEPGMYRFSQVRYVDEQQHEQTLSVGNWELSILDLPTAPLKMGSHSVLTVGKPERFEVELINQADQAIRLFDSTINSSTYPLSASLHLAQDGATAMQPVLGDAPPQPIQPLSSVTIELQPQQTQTIFFQLHGIEQLPTEFLVIQPLLSYQQAQNPRQQFILPLQVFSPPFLDDGAVLKYLDFLPVGAFHE